MFVWVMIAETKFAPIHKPYQQRIQLSPLMTVALSPG